MYGGIGYLELGTSGAEGLVMTLDLEENVRTAI